MTDTSEMAELANSFLTNLRTRNQEELGRIMAEDIVWSLPGRAIISGEAKGIADVVGRADRIASCGVKFILKNVLFGDSGFALSLNNQARRGDVVLDEHLATVCSVRDGKITRIDTYLHDIGMMEVFFV